MNEQPAKSASSPNGVNEEAQNEQSAVDAEALRARNAELEDRLLRALAETENTRRRGDRALAEMRQYAVADFARAMLTVADNLDRAIAASHSEPDEERSTRSLVEGIEATARLLASTLQNFGVQKIDARGAPFDPALHEAMLQTEDRTREPGTVSQVIEDGYQLYDRILRPARVAVTSRGPPSPESGRR
jgi:molecular chaperone GrpE